MSSHICRCRSSNCSNRRRPPGSRASRVGARRACGSAHLGCAGFAEPDKCRILVATTNTAAAEIVDRFDDRL